MNFTEWLDTRLVMDGPTEYRRRYMRAKRRDKNHKTVGDYLRAQGWSVLDLDERGWIVQYGVDDDSFKWPNTRRSRAMDIQDQRFSVVLPLPPRGVSANARNHFLVRSKAVKQARRVAWYWFRRGLPQGWRQRPVRLEIHYHCPAGSRGYCPRDTQNAIAALKASIDGMVDAKVVPDDNAAWVSWGAFRLTRQKGDLAAGVYVTVVAETAAGAEERGAEHGGEPCPT